MKGLYLHCNLPCYSLELLVCKCSMLQGYIQVCIWGKQLLPTSRNHFQGCQLCICAAYRRYLKGLQITMDSLLLFHIRTICRKDPDLSNPTCRSDGNRIQISGSLLDTCHSRTSQSFLGLKSTCWECNQRREWWYLSSRSWALQLLRQSEQRV